MVHAKDVSKLMGCGTDHMAKVTTTILHQAQWVTVTTHGSSEGYPNSGPLKRNATVVRKEQVYYYFEQRPMLSSYCVHKCFMCMYESVQSSSLMKSRKLYEDRGCQGARIH